jgi:hypothetical protein
MNQDQSLPLQGNDPKDHECSGCDRDKSAFDRGNLVFERVLARVNARPKIRSDEIGADIRTGSMFSSRSINCTP